MAASATTGGFDLQSFVARAKEAMVIAYHKAFVTFETCTKEAGIEDEDLQAGMESLFQVGLDRAQRCASEFEEFAMDCIQPSPPLETFEGTTAAFLLPEVPDWDAEEEAKLIEETESLAAYLKKEEAEVCKLQQTLSAMREKRGKLEAAETAIDKILEPIRAKSDELREMSELIKSTREMVIDGDHAMEAWRARMVRDDNRTDVMTDYASSILEVDPPVVLDCLE